MLGVCLVSMMLLYFRDDIYSGAELGLAQAKAAQGSGFVRMLVHFTATFKFLSSQVELGKRNTIIYIVLIGMILNVWDGLTWATTAVILIMLCLTKVINEDLSLWFFLHKKLTPTRIARNHRLAGVLSLPLVGILVVSGGEELIYFVQNMQAIIRHGPNLGGER